MEPMFHDRRQAGRLLADRLDRYRERPDVVVLALPRGGMPVAFEIAEALRAPLDVLIVRKLGVPGHEELAMGAIAGGGIRVFDWNVVRAMKVEDSAIDQVVQDEERELRRREQAYRGAQPAASIENRTLILVDDGLATGSTMRAAIAAVRQRRPAKVVVAVPTGAPETCRDLRAEADEVECAITPSVFFGVGQWYEDFTQTTDEEVRALLDRAAAVARQE